MAIMKLLDPVASERIDRYELIGELAVGGMAVVYLARLPGVGGFQRLVAIKRLHPHLSHEREFVEMFLDEARLAASIHHPNVVPILEVGQSAAGYYVVMEYIEGESLAGLLALIGEVGERIPTGVMLRVVVDALTGLQAAHELRDDNGELVELVHRDVSPQNILVGTDGAARITDFGVARASSRLANTKSGMLKGKLAYMAPEQARSGGTDRRADVFAAAIVLWEVLANRRLFKGETELHTLNKLLFEPIPRLRDVAPEAPEALDIELARALSREPAERHGSALEFADALERAAERAGTALASRREVAAFAERLLAGDIARQRETLRGRMSIPPEATYSGSRIAVVGAPSPSMPALRSTHSRSTARVSSTDAVRALAMGPRSEDQLPTPRPAAHDAVATHAHEPVAHSVAPVDSKRMPGVGRLALALTAISLVATATGYGVQKRRVLANEASATSGGPVSSVATAPRGAARLQPEAKTPASIAPATGVLPANAPATASPSPATVALAPAPTAAVTAASLVATPPPSGPVAIAIDQLPSAPSVAPSRPALARPRAPTHSEAKTGDAPLAPAPPSTEKNTAGDDVINPYR